MVEHEDDREREPASASPTPAEPDPEPANEPDEESPTRLRDAVGRALLGLLKLAGLFLPEILVALLGGVVGLVIGIVVGVEMTASLFSGPGPWARAGPVALVLPLFTALGPPIVGTLVGLVATPLVALIPHSLVMLVVARVRWRDRHVVLFSVAALTWLPALLRIGDGLGAVLAVAMAMSPITATLGFGGGALFVGARGVLAGRSVRTWWREADGSMQLTMWVLGAYSWLVTWLACALFCFLPTVPITLALSSACAIRLLQLRRRPAMALVLLALNVLHLGLIALGVYAVATDSPPR